MNASIVGCTDAPIDGIMVKRLQINTSPNSGDVDFSSLADHDNNLASIDLISIADLLRNAFVYPPHSIYRDVKIAATGFDPQQDMHDHPRFHFAFQSALATPRPSADVVDNHVLLKTYHQLLCDAVSRSTAGMQSPWLLQSGGKDSTSMAIALAEVLPQTTCLTYLGGDEENEVASARFVAQQLGLRHETLVCDPGRAYDRYLAMVPRMPLLTADFAALSYADLATEVSLHHGDGIIDALGSDQYFGVPLHRQERVLAMLARRLRLPQSVFRSRLVSRSFKLCFALSTLQMDGFERYFPGSRFSDAEVDALFGQPIATCSRQRMETYHADIATAGSAEAVRRISLVVSEASHLAKGMYITSAMSLRLVYPYCDEQLGNWVFHEVPDELLIGPDRVNKVLMRRYIAEHFQQLPYVRAKGCFRFDLRGLAKQRFDQVHAFAQQGKTLLPGASSWLEDHRSRLDNKYFASKFYLLAMTLPWLLSRIQTTPVHKEAATDVRGLP
jgi:asparagine synthetase B (glutamine-hydrolysing)